MMSKLRAEQTQSIPTFEQNLSIGKHYFRMAQELFDQNMRVLFANQDGLTEDLSDQLTILKTYGFQMKNLPLFFDSKICKKRQSLGLRLERKKDDIRMPLHSVSA